MAKGKKKATTIVVNALGGRYTLTGDHLDEFRRQDKAIKEDGAFWAWFASYVTEQTIKPEPQPSRLAAMWNSFGFAGAAERQRLFMALGAVNTAVHAVRSRPGRYEVRLAADGANPVSYTSYGDRLVVVSAEALLDRSLAIEDAIEITTAFALHEAGHTEHSKGMARLADVAPSELAGWLVNVLEDTRVERLVGLEFPGFARLFPKALAYLWKRVNKPPIPLSWPSVVSERSRFALAAVRWPDQFGAIVEDRVEFDWWRAWAARYKGRDNVRALVTEARDRILEGNPERPPAPNPGCASTVGGRIRASDAAELDRMFSEDFREEKLKPSMLSAISVDGVKQVPIISRRPVWAGKAEKGDSELARRLRAAFVFRPKAAEWTTRRLRSGQIDEEELWQASIGDYRVFEHRNIEIKPEADITLLVDMSGSMGGTRIDTARRLAQTLLTCLNGERGISVRVRGHTGDTSKEGLGAIIYRIWDEGDPESRLDMMGRKGGLEMAQNYDGWAIAVCVQELLAVGRPENQKLLIVLSDGEPAAGGYGGASAIRHVRKVTDWAEQNGVTVVQIAVAEMYAQGQMFKHWLPYKNDAQLPLQLTNVLKKAL